MLSTQFPRLSASQDFLRFYKASHLPNVPLIFLPFFPGGTPQKSVGLRFVIALLTPAGQAAMEHWANGRAPPPAHGKQPPPPPKETAARHGPGMSRDVEGGKDLNKVGQRSPMIVTNYHQ